MIKYAEIKTRKGPRMLPMVTLSNGKTYFIDERLRQLRNIKTPAITSMNMERAQPRWILKNGDKCDDFTRFITVSCAQCGKILFSGTEQHAKRLIIYCTDCASEGSEPPKKPNGTPPPSHTDKGVMKAGAEEVSPVIFLHA